MNKKILVLGLFVLVLAGFSLAQQQTDLPKAGTLPGNVFYGLDRAAESIHLAFTRNEVKRAELYLNYAGERISELNALVEKNNTKYVNKLTQDEEADLADAEGEIVKAAAKGQNTTLVSEHVAEMTYKHVLVLQSVLEKVPEQARDSILHAINVSTHGNENAVTRIEKDTGKPATVPKADDIKPVEGQKQGTEQVPPQETVQTEENAEAKAQGKLRMEITDKPAGLNITKLEVTISSVTVHTSGNNFEGETCENETYIDEECKNETVVVNQTCENETEIVQNCTNITGIVQQCTNITEEQEVCLNQTFINQTCTNDTCEGGVFIDDECTNGTLVVGECTNVSYEMPVCHNENITTGKNCVNETVVTGQNCTNHTVIVGLDCDNETELQEKCVNATKTRTTCSSTTGEGAAGWVTVVSSPKTFDLMKLAGVSELLGETNLEAGKYTQIRLIVSDANLWVSGVEESLKIPSGTIKLIQPFDINANQTTTLTLDFIASQSVHQAGSQYIMKPTIKVIVG